MPGSEWEHSGDLFSMGISIAKKSHFSAFQTLFAQTYTKQINSLSILKFKKTLQLSNETLKTFLPLLASQI